MESISMTTFQHPAMKTTAELIKRYGNPVVDQHLFEKRWMVVHILPPDIHEAISKLPAKLYLNLDIIKSFENVLRKLIAEGLHQEIKTWDGCFNVRKQRGSQSISRHSFGIALDINAAWNKLNGTISWSQKFLNVWRKEPGWICGADFHSRKDGMHFEFTAFNAF